MSFVDYISTESFRTPDAVVESSWLEHAPFAFYLVAALQPRVIVELGTHNGFSYFCFCQTVKRLELGTVGYAVDTWAGDEHAGFYAEAVFNSVSAINQKYSSFSTLMRMRFDEAVNYFTDNSIDLIHIDGRHFYDDVRTDFENWLPKLTPNAIVLFHDTNVRERGFGVWRLFAELGKKYRTFEFVHGHGLGVLALGEPPKALEAFFNADPQQADVFRFLYAQLGGRISDIWRGARAQSEADDLRRRLEGMKSQKSKARSVAAGLDAKRQSARPDISTLAAQLAAARAQTASVHRDSPKLRLQAVWRHPFSRKKQKSYVIQHRYDRAARSIDDTPVLILPEEPKNGAGVEASAQTATAGAQIVDPAISPKASVSAFEKPKKRKILRGLKALFVRPDSDRLERPNKQSRARDSLVDLPFAYTNISDFHKHVAVFLHVYYLETVADILQALNRIPFPFSLFISTDSEEKKTQISRYLNDWSRGSVLVEVVANRGRDIAPQFVHFRNEIVKFDYILHVHTKRSVHSSGLSNWLELVLKAILGSPEIIASIFTAFNDNPKLGVVAPPYHPLVLGHVRWGINFDLCAALATRMGLSLHIDTPCDFPAGSIFWARTRALGPLIDLNLTFDDFEPEQGQIDGTLAHAVERMVFISAEMAGFDWHFMAALPNGAVNLSIDSRESLLAKLQSARRRLLPESESARAPGGSEAPA